MTANAVTTTPADAKGKAKVSSEISSPPYTLFWQSSVC